METRKKMESLLNPNVQLDHFDDINFTHWKGKLFFLLIVLKISYVLNPNLESFSESKEDDSIALMTLTSLIGKENCSSFS